MIFDEISVALLERQPEGPTPDQILDRYLRLLDRAAEVRESEPAIEVGPDPAPDAPTDPAAATSPDPEPEPKPRRKRRRKRKKRRKADAGSEAPPEPEVKSPLSTEELDDAIRTVLAQPFPAPEPEQPNLPSPAEVGFEPLPPEES